MYMSRGLVATLRDTPAEAELISHQLMLRAGFIRRLASGLYTWLPLGLRVLRRVEAIVREEMNRAGAQEILMSSVQPAELWEESGRWEQYGPELLRLKDRHDRPFCVGPTHEEVVTDLARRELKSYKQLPINLYQIQTKFRDEIRPRFGVMRAREFIMKDAYSFDIDEAGMRQSYQLMYDAYTRIFTRLGLHFRAVLADTGSIGGNYSHEFQVLAEAGEDLVVYSDGSDYAANIEKAEALPPSARAVATKEKQKIATPTERTIADLVARGFPVEKTVKMLVVRGRLQACVALILRGDHTLNEVKAAHQPEVASPCTLVSEEEVARVMGCPIGSLGPIGCPIPIIVDRDAAVVADFVCGANEEGFHYDGVNWERDVVLPRVADLRNVIEGDQSPDGKGVLRFARGIEVGHVFQLGTKYSDAFHATVLDELGKPVVLKMGCYGIGVTRIVAAAIEQNYDERGMIWPDAMAPFQIALVPLQYHQSARVQAAADALYEQLCAADR